MSKEFQNKTSQQERPTTYLEKELEELQELMSTVMIDSSRTKSTESKEFISPTTTLIQSPVWTRDHGLFESPYTKGKTTSPLTALKLIEDYPERIDIYNGDGINIELRLKDSDSIPLKHKIAQKESPLPMRRWSNTQIEKPE